MKSGWRHVRVAPQYTALHLIYNTVHMTNMNLNAGHLWFNKTTLYNGNQDSDSFCMCALSVCCCQRHQIHRRAQGMTPLPTQAWLDTNKAKWGSNMLLCCGQLLLSFCQVEARYSWLFQIVFFFFDANLLDIEVFILIVPLLWPSKMIKCVCLLSTYCFNLLFLEILSFYSIIWKGAV